MKKIISILLAAIMLFSLTACSGGDKKASGNGDEKYVIRIGTTTEPDGHYIKGLEQFKEKVAEYTDGRVEVRLYPSSQLGNERDLIEGVSVGTVEGALISSAPLSTFSQDFLLFDLPFVITDIEAAYEFMDGEYGQEILASLEPIGIKALGFWENGFRHVTNNTRPIEKPEDAKGLKIRTMESPIHIASFEELGSIPTPMAWGEVFTALQQGTIDGQENPLMIIETNKLWEAGQKYISLTGHFYSPAIFILNKNLFDSYPEDIKEAILKAEEEARQWEREYSQELDKELIQVLIDNGVEVTEVNKDEWIEALKPVYDRFENEINQEHLKALLENQ